MIAKHLFSQLRQHKVPKYRTMLKTLSMWSVMSRILLGRPRLLNNRNELLYKPSTQQMKCSKPG